MKDTHARRVEALAMIPLHGGVHAVACVGSVRVLTASDTNVWSSVLLCIACMKTSAVRFVQETPAHAFMLTNPEPKQHLGIVEIGSYRHTQISRPKNCFRGRFELPLSHAFGSADARTCS